MQNLLELMRELRLSFPTALACIVGFLVMQNGLDRLGEYMAHHEKSIAARESYAEWVNDSCLPHAPNERAVARIENDKLACNIYQNLDYGGAPRVISAAVMERPQ